MASFNKVILMGNLTRDPQLRYLPSQMAVADFGLATNRKFRTAQGEDREEVTFVDVTAFGKQAELIKQYFQKGKPIFIEGRLKFDSWEDKQGGGKRSKLTVVIENFQFVGGRDGGGTGGGGGRDSAGDDEASDSDSGEPARPPRPQQARPQGSRPAPKNPPAEQPFSDDSKQFGDDDIPF